MGVADITGQFKHAFLADIVKAVADPAVTVSFGHPGPKLTDDMVMVGDTTTEQQPGPFSPRRARDLTIIQEGVVSCFRKGGPAAEVAASDAAFALLNLIEEYLRVTDTTLGGLVWWCFCTHAGPAGGFTAQQPSATGRVVEIPFVFTAQGRITS